MLHPWLIRSTHIIYVKGPSKLSILFFGFRHKLYKSLHQLILWSNLLILSSYLGFYVKDCIFLFLPNFFSLWNILIYNNSLSCAYIYDIFTIHLPLLLYHNKYNKYYDSNITFVKERKKYIVLTDQKWSLLFFLSAYRWPPSRAPPFPITTTLNWIFFYLP